MLIESNHNEVQSEGICETNPSDNLYPSGILTGIESFHHLLNLVSVTPLSLQMESQATDALATEEALATTSVATSIIQNGEAETETRIALSNLSLEGGQKEEEGPVEEGLEEYDEEEDGTGGVWAKRRSARGGSGGNIVRCLGCVTRLLPRSHRVLDW